MEQQCNEQCTTACSATYRFLTFGVVGVVITPVDILCDRLVKVVQQLFERIHCKS